MYDRHSERNDSMSQRRKKVLVGAIIITVSLAISAFFIPWEILIMRITPLRAGVQEELNHVVENNGFDGIMVLVDQGGDINEYTAGYNNRDEETPADTSKLFKIASIQKLYAAVAAAKLVDDGLLDLDATLVEMMPEYSDGIEYSDQITLRMMIQHRSGIPSYTDDPTYRWDNYPGDDQVMRNHVLGKPANFEPNSSYHYSNTNYLLLGLIMNNALGYHYFDFLKTEVLEPNNFNDTYLSYGDVTPDEVMSGYYDGWGPDVKPNDYGMVASIQDVAGFLRGLNTGTLLSDSEQEIYSEIYVYEHTGHIPGYQSIARYNAKTDTVIILFMNTSGSDYWFKMEALYSRINRIVN